MRVRTWVLPLLVLAVPAGFAADLNAVDQLVARLDELTLARLDGWKQSPDLRVSGLEQQGNDPARPAYDDSGWADYALETRNPVDACWFRRTIVLPAHAAGRAVGGPAVLQLGVKESGEVFVNGERRGKVDWQGTVELTADAHPGDRFVIAIRATNSGGSLLRLWKAAVEFTADDARAARRKVDDLALSLRVAQKLLGFDTYQTNARVKVDPGQDLSTIDRAEKERLAALLQDLARGFDTAPLARGDGATFDAALARLRGRIEPIAAFARRFTLFFDANAHIDAAWLWREKETVEVCRNTFASVMNMFRARPDFTYTQSSAAYYDWMKERDPALFDDIRQRVGDGRWEVVGGMWVEPDCNLPSGESWARQLLYGKRFFRQALGADVKLGWNPDSFGYNANMPALYRQAGIDAFITQKIGWNDTTVFPHRLFWWESKDGSRILAYFPFDYVNEVDDPFRLVDWMRQFEANTGFRKLLVLFGVGDHGGGPSLEMLARIDRLKSLLVYPTVEFGTAGSYLGWLRQQDVARLPVWKDELYLEYHQGTFTTQAAAKNWNRRSEVLLGEAEAFGALAALAGRPYAGADIEAAWREVMLNQFHDILPGSSIHEVYVDAAERWREADEIGRHERDAALAALAAGIDTSRAEGTPIVVFNPLGWPRTDAVRFALPAGEAGPWAVFDALTGAEIPSQVVRTGRYASEVLFIARAVPGLGHAVYDLRRRAPAPSSSALSAAGTRLENGLFRVELDPAGGSIRSLVDKRTGRELLAGPGNELQLLEDRPDAWDAWNIGLTGTRYPAKLRRIELVESGPVRAVLRAHLDLLKPGTKKDYPTEDFPSSFFTQDLVLWDGLDRIDFETGADWWEEKTMLKVAFPLAVTAPYATYDIPFGTIRRSTGNTTPAEKGQVEVPAQSFADLSDAASGVSLVTFAKHGFDVKGSNLRLSLLRSPKWPDPLADRGKHAMAYALVPHAGPFVAADTLRRAREYNAPLLAIAAAREKGPRPARHGFVALGPENLLLTAVKKAEDGAAWIFRWYDAAGVDSVAELTLPRAPQRAVRSNFLEEDGEPLPVSGNTLRVPTGHDAIVTVKVTF
ncbi:MAG: alpha-mannosidase [Acidobacteria bacterium]|nr:alpha-mannosidase [Acidobacteriota bacterium]